MLVLLLFVPAVDVVEADGTVTVRDGGRDVLVYHAAPTLPDGIDPVYTASGFLHPVRTPSGAVVTDGFPVDYAHQHGVFSTWTRVRFEGREIDFWNQNKNLGTSRHAGAVSRTAGGDSVGFTATIEHVDLSAPEGPKVALTETRTYLIHGERDGAFVFDVLAEQRCATDSPVELPKHKYGGSAVRGARGWTLEAGHRFLTDTGLGRIEGNHTDARWVASTGPAESGGPGDGDESGGGDEAGEKRTATIAMLSHPSNVRAPQPVRLHPTMPYFVFSPIVREPMVIRPGEPVRSHYRFVVHDGGADPARYEAEWKRLTGGE